MADFTLTDSGDIVFFEDENKQNTLKISFFCSNNKSLKISFNVINNLYYNQNHNNGLKITFDYKKIIPHDIVSIIDNIEELAQNITVAIKSYPKIEYIKHKNPHDKEVMNKFIEYIHEAIEDIIQNPYVEVTPKYQGIEIVYSILVYSNNKLITRIEV